MTVIPKIFVLKDRYVETFVGNKESTCIPAQHFHAHTHTYTEVHVPDGRS